jgi:hypothetical protein
LRFYQNEGAVQRPAQALAVALAIVMVSAASADGLLGHWTFDEPLDPLGTELDDRAIGQVQTGEAGAAVGTGCLALDGGYLEARVSTVPLYWYTRSISVWFKTNDRTGDRDTLWGWGEDAPSKRYDFRLDGGDLRIEIGGDGYTFPLASPVNDNQWHHALLVASTSSFTMKLRDHKLYVDGQLAGSASGDASLSTAHSRCRIGTGIQRGGGERDFSGMIDDFSVWGEKLTDSDAALIHGFGRIVGGDLSHLDALRDLADGNSGIRVAINGTKWWKRYLGEEYFHQTGATYRLPDGRMGILYSYSGQAVEVAPKLDQEIDFPALDPIRVDADTFAPPATASSGLPVFLHSTNPDIARTELGEITVIAPGITEIIAFQTGNDEYAPADPVSRTLHVLPLDPVSQTIAFASPGDQIVGILPIRLSATVDSGLPVRFSSSNPAIASVDDDVLSIHDSGVVTITATQVGNEFYAPAEPVAHTIAVRRIGPLGDPVWDPQNGFFTQEVLIGNISDSGIMGFDLSIDGLPEGALVHNASTKIGNTWLVYYREALSPGGSVSLVIHYAANAEPVPDPQITMQPVVSPDDESIRSNGSFMIDRSELLGKGFVIEFVSIPGSVYTVERSSDCESWSDVSGPITAAGSITRWLDDEFALSPEPRDAKRRFYRVSTVDGIDD